MDSIIRSAPVSPVAREIGRRRPRTATPETANPAGGIRPISPLPTIGKENAAAPTAAPTPSAAELGLEKMLREREAELAQLRGQLEKIKADLGIIHADAEKKGYAAGEAKGEKATTALLQERIERARSVAEDLGRAHRTVMDDAEDTLVEIVHATVCRMLGEQGATRDALTRMVREASASAREQIAVRLHPDDIALLRSGTEAREETVRLLADASVRLGGCMVESSTGLLDARFETQMEQLGAALLAARAARKSGELA